MTEGLNSPTKFWQLELSHNSSDAHKAIQSRHSAARTIQTAYTKYIGRLTQQNPKGSKNEALINAGSEPNVLSASLSLPSSISAMEDEDQAEFVSAVVVLQSYLHEMSDKKNVTSLTLMDEFEYDNFYKGMLAGVRDPETAVHHIVVCQSAARRMLAKRRVQEMKEYRY